MLLSHKAASLPPAGVLRATEATGGGARRIRREHLLNCLNRVNFRSGEIVLVFRHRSLGGRVAVRARPRPCRGPTLECVVPAADTLPPAEPFELDSLQVPDGPGVLRAPASELSRDATVVRIALPESAISVSSRRSRRHACTGVRARLTQQDRVLRGELADFSALSLGVVLPQGDGTGARALVPGMPVDVVLEKAGGVVFSGPCDVVRRTERGGAASWVLRPLPDGPRPRQPKGLRTGRHALSPMPSASFRHPFTDRAVTLRLADLSSGGFSVEEEGGSAVLLPGMRLPEVAIEFLHRFSLRCSARVLYAHATGEDAVRSGLAIVDMSVPDRMSLFSILFQCTDAHTSVFTANLDQEALWDFFFDTGFLYPEKYAHLVHHKARFRSLYRKLYGEIPHLARHVVYEDRGVVRGQVSMIRFYRATWMLHHHAALSSARHKAGLAVMEQILRYANEFHGVFPGEMRYIAAYFRPNNRFANRAFGGAAAAMGDPGRCSCDAFAYCRSAGPGGTGGPLPAGWTLDRAAPADLAALAPAFGRLLLDGLDLTPDAAVRDAALDREFAEAGLRRERRLLALRHGGNLVALLVANLSDPGLNLSDLLNCIQVFALATEAIPPRVAARVIARVAALYGAAEVPVLVHPPEAAAHAGLGHDRVYNLTVLDMRHFGPYFSFMEELTGRGRRARE